MTTKWLKQQTKQSSKQIYAIEWIDMNSQQDSPLKTACQVVVNLLTDGD